MNRRALTAMLMVVSTLLVAADGPAPAWDSVGDGNPLLPGYFADPSIVRDGGRWYIYATIDPWGDDRLGMWQSDNGRDWTFSMPDWPTKAAATSPTSGDAKVWAPSVVKAANGRWYMYVSVGNEVWVGTAPSPAGPWRDAHAGKPLIAKTFDPRYHMIDAEAFIDSDGQAYLYWGSGWNWTNGHCFAVKLKPDMVTFDGAPRDVTPANYFEGPFMVKQGSHYLLTYSDGNTTKDTYKVRYAIGDTPVGPFREGPGSPILSTDAAKSIISPGHHAVFRSGGRLYILYHRQGLPFISSSNAVLRQIAVDPLTIAANGTIATVVPSHGGDIASFAKGRTAGLRWNASGRGADAMHGPERAGDNNYATLWRSTPGEPGVLVADLGGSHPLRESRFRMEFANRNYTLRIERSDDGVRWSLLADARSVSGSPIKIAHRTMARYLRLTTEAKGVGMWEWSIF